MLGKGIKTVCFVTPGRKFQKFPENSGVKILVPWGGPLSYIAYYFFLAYESWLVTLVHEPYFFSWAHGYCSFLLYVIVNNV